MVANTGSRSSGALPNRETGPTGGRKEEGSGGPPRGALERAKALLDSAERVAGIGSWEWTPEGGELVWSDNTYRLQGLEPGEIEPSLEFVRERAHPADRQRLSEEIETVRQGADGPRRFEYRIVQSDGRIRQLRSIIVAVEASPGQPRRLLGTIQDVTEERGVRLEVAAHIAAATALAEWSSFETGAPHLLRSLVEAMEFDVGALWIPRENVLECRGFWREPSVGGADFETATRELVLPPGRGLLRRVYEQLEPIVLPNVLDEGMYMRRESAARAGLRGAIAFPAVYRREALAIVELYSRDEMERSHDLARSLVSIGQELGVFLSVHRGDLYPSLLTPREREVIQLAAEGHTGPRIAEDLGLSLDTVKTHFKHVYDKLGVSDRASAVAVALRDGLID